MTNLTNIQFYILASIAFTAIVSFLFYIRKGYVLNGIIYYPLLALLYAIICETQKEIDIIDPRLLFSAFNILSIIIYFVFIPRRKISHFEEKRRLYIADKIISISLLLFKKKINKDTADYIMRSNLTHSEKITAKKIIQEKQKTTSNPDKKNIIEIDPDKNIN